MAKLKKYSIIIAVDEKHGIWKDNSIPWKLKNDLQHFKSVTTTTRSKKKQNVVIMWRKTWESLPKSVRPLPGRINYILSSGYKENPSINADGSFWFNSFESAHEYASAQKNIETIYIIGGSYLYNLVLDLEYLQHIYLTRVYGDFNCDVFMWKIPPHFKITSTSEKQKEWNTEYQMFTYKNQKSFFTGVFSPLYLVLWVLFILILWYLLYASFANSSTQPKQTPDILKTQIVPKPTLQENKEETTALPENNSPSQKQESTNTDIPKKTESIGSVTIHYPETGIRSLDRQIQNYKERKKILYKILVHNASLESETLPEITLDYEIISETSDSITVSFVETISGKITWEEERVYIK